jgi:hypothetical protein
MNQTDARREHTPDTDDISGKLHLNTMQHYLEYLKSDAVLIPDEESLVCEPALRDVWAVAPTVYPPFED